MGRTRAAPGHSAGPGQAERRRPGRRLGVKPDEDPMGGGREGSYVRVCATVRSRGWRIRIRSIVEHEVVLDTLSGVINADKGKTDSDRSSTRSNDDPFAVSVVGVSAGIARAGDQAAVSIKSPATACKQTGAGSLSQPSGTIQQALVRIRHNKAQLFS